MKIAWKNYNSKQQYFEIKYRKKIKYDCNKIKGIHAVCRKRLCQKKCRTTSKFQQQFADSLFAKKTLFFDIFIVSAVELKMSNDNLPNYDLTKHFLRELFSSLPAMTNNRKENGWAKVCDQREHQATPGRIPASFLAFCNLTADTIKSQIMKCQILYLLLNWICRF